jgi:Helix-turn-helix domain
MNQQFISQKETADILNVHTATVYQYVRSKKLTQYRNGRGKAMYLKDEVLALLDPVGGKEVMNINPKYLFPDDQPQEGKSIEEQTYESTKGFHVEVPFGPYKDRKIIDTNMSELRQLERNSNVDYGIRSRIQRCIAYKLSGGWEQLSKDGEGAEI